MPDVRCIQLNKWLWICVSLCRPAFYHKQCTITTANNKEREREINENKHTQTQSNNCARGTPLCIFYMHFAWCFIIVFYYYYYYHCILCVSVKIEFTAANIFYWFEKWTRLLRSMVFDEIFLRTQIHSTRLHRVREREIEKERGTESDRMAMYFCVESFSRNL